MKDEEVGKTSSCTFFFLFLKIFSFFFSVSFSMSESILKILESSRFGFDKSSTPASSRRGSPKKSPGTPRLRKVVDLAMDENGIASGRRDRGHSVSSRVSIMDKTSAATLRNAKSVDRPEFNEVKTWVKQLQKDAHVLREQEFKASTDVDFLNAQIRAMRKAFGWFLIVDVFRST